MSRIFCLAKVVAVVGLCLAPVFAWAANGYVFEAAGSVSVALGNNAPHVAAKNENLFPGSVVRTGDNSHAVLKFEDGELVTMQANSTFQVREYRYEPRRAEQSSVVFSMFKGTMRFITGEIGQRNPSAFRLATPDATIRVRGTDFLVAITNNATYTQVLSGGISVTNAAGMTMLNAGQTGLTPSATTLTTLLPDSSAPAGIFSQIASIPVPPAMPGPVPAPAPAPVVAPAGAGTSMGATNVASGATSGSEAATATTTQAAGGAAAGGAAASSAAAAGGAATGISATTIGIGVGVAALVAAAAHSSSTTTHH